MNEVLLILFLGSTSLSVLLFTHGRCPAWIGKRFAPWGSPPSPRAAGLWRIYLAVPLAAVFLLGLATSFAQQTAKPISKKGLEDALKIGGLKSPELVAIIKKRGVDFEVTPDVEIELLRLGAKPEVVDAARANYKGAPDSPETQPGLSGNWAGTFRTCAQGQSTIAVRIAELAPDEIIAMVEIAIPNQPPGNFTSHGILNTMNGFLVLPFSGWQHQPPGMSMGNIGGYITYKDQKPDTFTGIIRPPGCGQITLKKQ